MPLPASRPWISSDDYLMAEASSDMRHEYVAGQLFAMAGAGETHNRISLNIAFHLRAAARGTPCGVFISDMKVRVAHHDAFYYPDVVLTCDPADAHTLYKQAPCFIAEVLSPSTEVIDRREKLIAYRALDALRYYLLADQQRQRLDIYSRERDSGWQHRLIEAQGALEFHCGPVRFAFSLADVYEDVVLADRA